MKARDLKVGDIIDGWTVTDVWNMGEPVLETCAVLLTLERQRVGVQVAFTSEGRMQRLLDPEILREWYFADEDVEVKRDE